MLTTNGQNNKYTVTNSCEGFSYSFTKPQNWVLDSTNAANYLAHSAIFKSKVDYDNGGLIIQLLAYKKQDENTNEDLDYDVNSYKNRYKNLKEKEFKINHPNYRTYSTELYVEGNFYQYIVYINPGKEYKFGVSAALNINKNELDQKDLETFKEIIKSIQVLK
ncbi:hypothetical protein [Tenacibaculum amylolyticum]|uniref:hypothetical protein n=1 Tax=Tenacibaculum amylolyticum TaxID=104269 RepID=UPI003894B9CD